MLHRAAATVMQVALFVALAVLVVPAQAAWLQLAGGEPGASANLTVRSLDDNLIEVTVSVPGVDLVPTNVDGRPMVDVVLPGAAPLLEAGAPALPVLAQAIRLPGQGTPQLEISDARWTVIGGLAPAPSRGPLSRMVDPAQVPRRPGPVYESDQIFPAQMAELGDPFLVRDHRGVSLRVHPVRWDAGRGELLALTNMTLQVSVKNDQGLNPVVDSVAPARRAFGPVLDAVFGTQVDKAEDDQGLGYGQSEYMLLVTTEAMRGPVQDLASWKRQCGHLVDILTMESVGGSVLGLKDVIRERYLSDAGLAYVVIIGDVDQVPTQAGNYNGSDSDGIYGLLSGDDLYVDVLVSRLPARNSSEARVMINRTMAYERDVLAGAAWCGRSAGIASDEGNPADFERAEVLRDQLLAAGQSDVARIYQGFGGDRGDIADSVDQGVGLVNYLGHGSGTSWLSVPFTSADVHGLTNTTAWPWIIDVSCSNGDFSLDECFAEAWLRSSHDGLPAGAVAMLSASSATSWVPPTVMQATMIDELTLNGETELGALYAAGVAAVLVQYEGVGQDEKLMEQYNLFGDCSLRVRMLPPTESQVVHPGWIPVGATTWTVQAPAGSRIALTCGDERLARADATEAGSVDLELSRGLADMETVTLTVTADHSVTYAVEVPVQTAPTTVTETPLATTLLANYPNPFNPSTTVAFELAEAGAARLSIVDVRGRLVTTLVHDQLTAGRHEVQWHGRDGQGRAVASGTYVAVLDAGVSTQTRLLTLVQ